jgi:hypothetical protein
MRIPILSILLMILLPMNSWAEDHKPRWIYKTWRPFLAGWSSASNPLVDDEKVYACIGYGWSKNRVNVVALNKATGQVVWKNEIAYPCTSFVQSGEYIVAANKNYTIDKEKAKTGPAAGIIWHRHIFIIDKSSGQTIDKIENAEMPATTRNWLYFSQNNSLVRYDLANHKTLLSFEGEVNYTTTSRDSIVWGSQNAIKEINDDSADAKIVIQYPDKPLISNDSKDFICSYNVTSGETRSTNRLVCANRQTRNVVFEEKNISSASYTMLNNTLYYWQGGSSKYTYRVDLNNPQKEPLPFPMISSFIWNINDSLLLSADAHDINVIDPKSEKVMWKYFMQGWIKGASSDVQHIYIADDSGKLSTFPIKNFKDIN